jgi:hypothetical protein
VVQREVDSRTIKPIDPHKNDGDSKLDEKSVSRFTRHNQGILKHYGYLVKGVQQITRNSIIFNLPYHR